MYSENLRRNTSLWMYCIWIWQIVNLLQTTIAKAVVEPRADGRLDFSSFDLEYANLTYVPSYYIDQQAFRYYPDANTQLNRLYFPLNNATEFTFHMNDHRWLTVVAKGDWRKVHLNDCIFAKPVIKNVVTNCKKETTTLAHTFQEISGDENDDQINFSLHCQSHASISTWNGNDNITIVTHGTHAVHGTYLMIYDGYGNDTMTSAKCIAQHYHLTYEPYAVDTIYNFNLMDEETSSCGFFYKGKKPLLEDHVEIPWIKHSRDFNMTQQGADVVMSLPQHQKLILKNASLHLFAKNYDFSMNSAEYDHQQHENDPVSLAHQYGHPDVVDRFWIGPWPHQQYTLYDFEMLYGKKGFDWIDLSAIPIKSNDIIPTWVEMKSIKLMLPYNTSVTLYSNFAPNLLLNIPYAHKFHHNAHALTLRQFHIHTWPTSTTQWIKNFIHHPPNKIIVINDFKVFKGDDSYTEDILDLSAHEVTHLDNITVSDHKNDLHIGLPDGYTVILHKMNARDYFYYYAAALEKFNQDPHYFTHTDYAYPGQWPRINLTSISQNVTELRRSVHIDNNIPEHLISGFNFSRHTLRLDKFDEANIEPIQGVCTEYGSQFVTGTGHSIYLVDALCSQLFIRPMNQTVAPKLFFYNHTTQNLNSVKFKNQEINLQANPQNRERIVVPPGFDLQINIYGFNITKSQLDFSLHPLSFANEISLYPSNDDKIYLHIKNNNSIVLHNVDWVNLYHQYGLFVIHSLFNTRKPLTYEHNNFLFKAQDQYQVPKQLYLQGEHIEMTNKQDRIWCYLPSGRNITVIGTEHCGVARLNLNESQAVAKLFVNSDKRDAIVWDSRNESFIRLVNTSIDYVEEFLQQVATPEDIYEKQLKRSIHVLDTCHFEISHFPNKIIISNFSTSETQPVHFYFPFFNQAIYNTNCYKIFFNWESMDGYPRAPTNIVTPPILKLDEPFQVPNVFNPINIFHKEGMEDNATLWLSIKYASQYINPLYFLIHFKSQAPIIAYGDCDFSLDDYGQILEVYRLPEWLYYDKNQKRLYGKPNNYQTDCSNVELLAKNKNDIILAQLLICTQRSSAAYLAFREYLPYFMLYLCLALYRFVLTNPGKNKLIQHEIIKQKPMWLRHQENDFTKLVQDAVTKYITICENEQPTNVSRFATVRTIVYSLFFLTPYPHIQQEVRACIHAILSKTDCHIDTLPPRQRSLLVNQAAYAAYLSLSDDFDYYNQICSYFDSSQCKLLVDSFPPKDQREIFRQFSVALSDVINNSEINLEKKQSDALNQEKDTLVREFVIQQCFHFPIRQEQYNRSLLFYFKQHASIEMPAPELNNPSRP